MKEAKHIRCHWCNNELELIGDFILECTQAHATIIFNTELKDIMHYTLFFDVNPVITTHESLLEDSVRYRIVSGKVADFTFLSSRKGTAPYKPLLTIKYVPLRLDGSTIHMEPILNKLKTLLLFS